MSNARYIKRRAEKGENDVNTETWFIKTWRPSMAWVYMAICLFDFIIAPTGSAVLITFYKSTIPVWKSLTLEGGGIIHVAFGAILGVAAWGRTREAVVNTEMGYGGYGGGYGRDSIYTREDVYVGRGPNDRRNNYRDRQENDRDRRDNDRDRRDNDRQGRRNDEVADELTDNMHDDEVETPTPRKPPKKV